LTFESRHLMIAFDKRAFFLENGASSKGFCQESKDIKPCTT
jgi:hypothetical protein